MPYPRSENKVNNLILETAELEEEAGRLLLQIDENKKKIQAFFDEKGIKQLEVPVTMDENGSSVKVVCKKSERATIKYDVEKLRKKVDSEIFNEVTNRTYIINDINEMIALVRDAGVSAKDFKKLLDTKISVDTQAIKRLYDAKEITLKQLEGAYTATISKSIKIIEETGDKN